MSLNVSALPSLPKNGKQDTNHRSADYHPSIWGDHFLSYASNSVETDDEKKLQELREDIKKMLKADVNKPAAKHDLVDAIQRLGVSYHFQTYIDQILEKVYKAHEDSGLQNENDDLYSISLEFRLLRQHGYNISSDIFNKFKDNNGDFKASLAEDIRGILSFYEATHFRVHGETILDEALVFTTTLLEYMATQLSSPLAAHVKHALYKPLRKGLPRVEARQYMTIYQEDSLHNEMKILVRNYFNEAKWCDKKYVPTIEEYLSVALLTGGHLTLAATSFVGMGDVVTEESFDWVISNPKIVKASSIIGRLMDDIAGHKDEQKRAHVASAVECYMNQHNVSEEEAVKLLRELVEDAWKDINEEFIKPAAVPMPLLERVLNLTRVIDLLYKEDDCYTNSHLMKRLVASLLTDPVLL
ncbi:hypothetical protein Patl1_04328 [Pistacia atlantica]|uniref:Uncharacterized protein n=1 Tax=Pistacia atlantica TaxID=434234 RepID=A0ACC1BTU4_9ROSI|nr:hypothetical protein Patl1_04328 [Pistacia atlantica]